jgi:multisubunit Na+/H+ antiporter MnhG subunit
MKMGRILVAVSLIFLGLVSLLRSLNVLPNSYCRLFQELAAKYWPVLLVLFGVKMMVKGHSKTLDALLGLLIIILVALWVVCKWAGPSDWLNV